MRIDILLRGTILFSFPIQRSIKSQNDSMALHLILLLVLRYQRPRQTRFLHRLKTEKKHLKCELLLGRRNAKTPQNENCSKHIGLGGKYLVRQSQLLFGGHLLYCLNGSKKGAARNPTHL